MLKFFVDSAEVLILSAALLVALSMAAVAVDTVVHLLAGDVTWVGK